MEISIDEFKKEYFPPLKEEFHRKTMESIIKNGDSIRKRMREQMDLFIGLAITVQKEIPIEIGLVQVALLNTSLHLGKPQIAFTAYNEGGYFGQELLTVKRDAGWLFEAWEDYKNSIENEIAKLHAEAYIRSEGVRQLMWESFPFLQMCLFAATKYLYFNVDQFEKFEDLIKAPGFSIRVGSYMDWGKVVYRKEGEEDIFFDTRKKDFSFYRFQRVIYNQKVFKNMNLGSTKFSECEFVNCEFENVNLCDAWFEKCNIRNCTFENVKLLGLTLGQTTVKRTHFHDCITKVNIDAPNPEDLENAYKPMEIVDCVFDEESKIRGEA